MNIMNNSTFGKTMEKLRKRLSVRLVDNAKDSICKQAKLCFTKKI